VRTLRCPACGFSGGLADALARAELQAPRCPRCGSPVPVSPGPAPLPEEGGSGKAGMSRSVAPWQAAAVGAGTLLLWFSMARRGLLFTVLSGADLVFHEAGHPVFGLLGSRFLGILGGTLGQLSFPVVAMAVFWRQGRPAWLATASVWLGFNLVDIGRYAADGNKRALPLITQDANTHDWWNLLGMLGLRGWAEPIGGVIQALGFATMALAPAWLGWLLLRARSRQG